MLQASLLSKVVALLTIPPVTDISNGECLNYQRDAVIENIVCVSLLLVSVIRILFPAVSAIVN